MEYREVLQRLTAEELIKEKAIVKKEEKNLYIKKKELDEEFERRLEDNV